jgi:hypothetical protein
MYHDFVSLLLIIFSFNIILKAVICTCDTDRCNKDFQTAGSSGQLATLALTLAALLFIVSAV